MDRQTKVKINTCSKSGLLRLPGVVNKIADMVLHMREEGVQFNREKLAKILYLVTSPELFEMVDYTSMVSDFTDLDPLKMFQKLQKIEEPRETKGDELFIRRCPHRSDRVNHHTSHRYPNRLRFINPKL